MTAKVDKILSFIHEKGDGMKCTGTTAKIRAVDTLKAYQSTKNLTEFRDLCDDRVVMEHTISSKACQCYLENNGSVARKPTGKGDGCISNGISFEDEQIRYLEQGGNQKWYRFKINLLDHLLGFGNPLHVKARKFKRELAPVKQRGEIVVKSQIRIALNAIKDKAAAYHYEDRMAELYIANADVGDFSYFRKMFVRMVSAICAYADYKVITYLAAPLPNAGICEHFYVTGDKSTNHRSQTKYE